MSYHPRNGTRQAMGGLWDQFKNAAGGAAKGALSLYGEAQKNAGAAEALMQQQAMQQSQRAGGGITTTHLVIGGAAVLGLVLLLKK